MKILKTNNHETPITISIQGKNKIELYQYDTAIIKLNKGAPEAERPSIQFTREGDNIDVTIFKYPGTKIVVDDDAAWKTTGLSGKEEELNDEPL